MAPEGTFEGVAKPSLQRPAMRVESWPSFPVPVGGPGHTHCFTVQEERVRELSDSCPMWSIAQSELGPEESESQTRARGSGACGPHGLVCPRTAGKASSLSCQLYLEFETARFGGCRDGTLTPCLLSRFRDLGGVERINQKSHW